LYEKTKDTDSRRLCAAYDGCANKHTKGVAAHYPIRAGIPDSRLAYLTVGWDILLTAAKNAIKGKVLDENFLMSVATIGTFFIAQYAEGVAVMLFYQVGELFQSHAVAIFL
jgi:hypothetical protein